MMNLTIADQLKLALTTAHAQFLKEDDPVRKADALKRMKGFTDEFLSFVPHDRKFIFQTTEGVLRKSSMNIGEFDPWEGSVAFEILAKYAHNLLEQPWRKEFRFIKLSSGFFYHNISSHLTDAEEILVEMGYELGDQGQLKLQHFNELRLKTASMDLIIASQECLMLSQTWQRVGAQEPDALLTIGDVFEYRAKTVGGAETVSEKLIQDIRKRRSESTYKPVTNRRPIISNTTRLNEICNEEEEAALPPASASTLSSFCHSGNDLSSTGFLESEIITGVEDSVDSKIETDLPTTANYTLKLKSKEMEQPKEVVEKGSNNRKHPSGYDVNLFYPSLTSSSVSKTTALSKGESQGKKRLSLYTSTTNMDTNEEQDRVEYSNQRRISSTASSSTGGSGDHARGISSYFNNFPVIPKTASKVSEIGFQSRNARHSMPSRPSQQPQPPIQFSKVTPEEDEYFKNLYFKEAPTTKVPVTPKLYSVSVSGSSPIRASSPSTNFSVSDDLSYSDFCQEVRTTKSCPICTLNNPLDKSKCDACDYSFVHLN